VRHVDQVLAVGDAVDGVHQRPLDAEAAVERRQHGGEAVRGARGVRDHPVARRLEAPLVDAEAEGGVGVGDRRRDDDAAHAVAARAQVLGGRRPPPEAAGGLDHHLDPVPPPVDPPRRGLVADRDRPAVDLEPAVGAGDPRREAAVDGVVAEQPRQRRGVGGVVRRHHLDPELGPQMGDPEQPAADPAEPVDPHPRHAASLSAGRDPAPATGPGGGVRGWGLGSGHTACENRPA
jgi:hypothetical protein